MTEPSQQRSRVPGRIARGSLAVGIAGATALAVAPPALAGSDTITNGALLTNQLAFGPRHSITQVTVTGADGWTDCTYAQYAGDPYGATYVLPGEVRAADNGDTTYPYSNLLVGHSACSTVYVYHPYDGLSIKRGMNYKSGLSDPPGTDHMYGGQTW